MNPKQLLFIGLLIAGLFFFNLFPASLLGIPTTSYSTVTATESTITYSNPISPDLNILRNEHIFQQWVGGNILRFDLFYQNIGLIPFYLKQGLGINPPDFNILAGDGDKTPFGCHLSPNYCQPKPTASKVTFNGLDADGCPRYNTFSAGTPCKCYSVYKTCQGDAGWDPCTGAAQCGWTDCSSYTQTGFNVGGSTKTTGYKAILESDGWNYDGTNECFTKSSPTPSRMDNIANNFTCKVEGILDNGLSYNFNGEVTGYEGNQGFGCRITDRQLETTTSKKIVSGTVTFYEGQKQSVIEPITVTPITQTVIPVVTQTCNTGNFLNDIWCQISSWFSGWGNILGIK